MACEACHGKGSWHAALPKTQVFEKRETIVNPAKLTMGVAVQICGSCHNRGKATQYKGAGWPVGYQPGKALEAFYEVNLLLRLGMLNTSTPTSFPKATTSSSSTGSNPSMPLEGVTCTSCHYRPPDRRAPHPIPNPVGRIQVSASNATCRTNQDYGPFYSLICQMCMGCHMPRIAKSAESGDIHSHVFVTLLPEDTIKRKIPNSCQTCHKHKYESLERLQMEWERLAKVPTPRGKVIEPLPYHRSPKPK